MRDTVERSGEVIGFANGVAKIRLEQASGCSACGSRGSCASGNAAQQVILLPMPEHTQLGDQLSVAMPSSALALAAILGYLFPPLCLLLGAIAADTVVGGNVAAVSGALAGFVAGLLLARLIAFFALGSGLTPTPCRTDFQTDLSPGEPS